jgi:molybdenum cofactor cytidylyltransferase
VLGQTLTNLLASPVDDVLVVTGADAGAVVQVVTAYGVRSVHNPDYAAGEMISSLQTALRALPESCSAVLVVLADQPLIPPTIFAQVIAAFRAGRGEIVAPVYRGQRGHPVLIGRRFFPALLALPPGSAPRDLLREHESALYLLPVESDTIVIDLDRPVQYARYRPQSTDEEKDANP